MSVVANVAINVDSRDAAAKLRQFQQQSTAAGRAAEQLQAFTDKLQSAFTKQRGSTAELAKRLRELKTEYERLTASAKESARAGGEGFSAATVGKLRKLSSEINSTREAFLNSKAAAASYKAELDKVATASDGLNRTQRKASTEINSLAASLGRLAIAYFGLDAAARATTNAIQQGITYESAAARLRNLSAAFGETEEATQLAERASTRFGQGITQSTEQVAQLYGRLRPLGLTLSEVEAIQNGFNTAARLSGATAAESAGALLQLSQALGAGALRGEEFNSVAEQAPLVLQALGKELNVPIGQLKGLAQEGKITSDVVIRALARISAEGADKLSGSLDTSAQRVKDLQNAFERLQIALSKLALPSLLRVLEGITVQLENGTRFVTNLGDAWDYVAGRLAPVVGLFQQLASNPLLRLGGQAAGKIFEQTGPGIALRGLDFLRNQVPAGIANLAQRGRQSRQQSFVGPATPQWFGPAPRMVPTQSPRERLGVTDRPDRGGGRKGGKSEAEKAAEKAKRAAEQLKEQTEQQLKAAKDLQFTQANQLLQLRAKNDFERTFVEFGIKRSEIERKYNELLQQSKSTEETKLLQQARAAEYKQSSLILEQRALELTKQATQPLDDILKNLQDQAAYQREYGELIKNGTNPELAKQIIEINRAYEASVAALEPAIAAARAAVTKAEAEGASATEIEKYRKELERIQEIQGGLEIKRGQAIGAAKEGAAKQPTVLDGIGERIKQLQADLNPIKLATDSIVSGADAIGQAFGQAFQDVATGAKSTQEALADAFKGIGQAFISMASEIIAKQLTLILLQTIFNALSGGLGAGGSAPRGKPGAKAPNGLPYYGPAFADGGFVTGPTQALIGEGGEPEYVIPASKMRSAMARYSSGARGSSVIPQNGDSTVTAGGGGSTFTLETVVINNVEYATVEQVRAMGQRAAAQGAQGGHARSMRTLQHSRSQRARLGMS